jgi:hypothetical protein
VACSTHGVMRNACKILVGKPEGKRALGNRRRLEDNIKMDLTEIDWINLARIRTCGRPL